MPELVRGESEPLVEKTYADAFEETDLEPVLAERGIGRVVIAGAQTDECIRSTLHGAIVRGYDAMLVGDAHTTEDLSAYGAPPPDKVIAHTNLYWQYHTAPGRHGGHGHDRRGRLRARNALDDPSDRGRRPRGRGCGGARRRDDRAVVLVGAAWLGSMLPDADLAGAHVYRRTRLERRVCSPGWPGRSRGCRCGC